MNDDIEKIQTRLDNLEQSVAEIKTTLEKAFEGEQSKWQQVFDAVDMNFEEIKNYANDTFLHADTFWEMRNKGKLN